MAKRREWNLFNDKFAPQKTHEELEAAVGDVFENQRQRIASALELPDGVEVVLCPSGVSQSL